MKKVKNFYIYLLMIDSLRHFELCIFSFLSSQIISTFFPIQEILMHYLVTYTILVINLFMRILGTFLFGTIACYINPLIGIHYAVFGMFVSIFLIGCLPSYTSIGIISSLLFSVLIPFYGFCSGGETLITKFYIFDKKSYNSQYTVAYIYNMLNVLVIMIASSISWIIMKHNFQFGWRLCFTCTALIGGSIYLILYIKFFAKVQLNKVQLRIVNIKNYLGIKYLRNLLNILVNHKLQILLITFTTGLSYVTYFVPFILMNKLVPFGSNIKYDTMLLNNNIFLLIDIILIFLLNKFLKKINYVMFISSLLFSISILFLPILFQFQSLFYINFFKLWIIVLGTAFLFPLNLLHYQITNFHNRYIIIALGDSLGRVIGKITPMICMFIFYNQKSLFLITFFLFLLSLFTSILVYNFSCKN